VISKSLLGQKQNQAFLHFFIAVVLPPAKNHNATTHPPQFLHVFHAQKSNATAQNNLK
jgi:hypothetical protein